MTAIIPASSKEVRQLPSIRPVPSSAIETNPTLADDPALGKMYFLVEPVRTEIKTEYVQERIRGTHEVRTIPWDTMFIFAELEPLSPGENFRFYDSISSDGNMYEAIRLSEWFRVAPSSKNGERFSKANMFIIRGFNRNGKCIYYHEWSPKEEVVDSKSDIGPLGNIQGLQKPGLPSGITVPKMREPVFE